MLEADGFTIRINDRAIMERLSELAARSSDLTPVMADISEIIKTAVEENFRVEGRPKWVALSPVTIKKREKKGKWPGKILQVNGRLAGSLTSKHDSNSATVGVISKYARIHQFGGQAGKGKKVTIPARPYLKLENDDKEAIIHAIEHYLSP